MTPTAPPARGAAQHTPGPWRVAYNSRRTRLGTRVAGAGGYVAYVITRDAAAANARLIAAAPDLLEALRAIVADYADDIDITRLTHARTAIAKAAGGQP